MASETVRATLQSHDVYLGIWTNWSQGATTGLTLTTTLRNGGLLIAFLALFVTFTGTCFWTIVSFAVHQIQSRHGAETTMYHQRQAILRNSDTSAAAFWRLSRYIWAWRKSPISTLKGSIPPLIISLITFGAFAAAGVFSSRVASSKGGEVLVVGDQCAFLDKSRFTLQNLGQVEAYLSRRIRSSANYASACYTDENAADSCRTFVRSNIPFNINKNAPCPFPGNDRVCRSANGTVHLDSGLINSHFDLGINSPPSERFLYRTMTECAPIHNDGFTRVNTSRSPANLQFFYGPDSASCKDTEGCTFQHPVRSAMDMEIGREYTLAVSTNYAQPEGNITIPMSTWKPIPELLNPNTDTSIIFLAANNIPYLAPVDDPWFSAGHNNTGTVNSFLGRLEVYFRDEPARALACTHRYQFCNPAAKKEGNTSCTPLLGIFQAMDASLQLFQQPEHRSKFLWSATAILYMASGFPEYIIQMRSGSLLARESLASPLQAALPENQWELEVENWFKFTLADLQRAILNEAIGPAQTIARQFHTSPNSAGEFAVCNNQKIRSDSFTSFNVLGLVLIFSIGGFIILLSVSLPTITSHMQRHGRHFANLEWISNDTLQLQRLAHEAVGAGVWEGACDSYPRTRKNDYLAVLDTANQRHPLLKVSSTTSEHEQKDSTTDSVEESLLAVDQST